MAYAYAVTAQKPTAVTHSLKGNFTGPEDDNLVVGKGTRFEVHTVTEEGLQPVVDVGLYGRIAEMLLFRPAGEACDLLFISTESKQFCLLAFDAAANEIVTRACGDMSDPIGRDTDRGQIALVDPARSMIGLHIYDGLFKIIPITPGGGLSEAFNVRLVELHVLDMVFLDGSTKLAVLYQDAKDARHIKTYDLDVDAKSVEEGVWKQSNVDLAASMLIPVPAPLGGLLCVGESTLVYYSCEGAVGDLKAISISRMAVKAYGRMDADGSRFLLGDNWGGLHVVVLKHDGAAVTDLGIDRLGETSIASSITYLDSSYVFVGSTFGDSQLVQLSETRDEETGSYLSILESYDNLGPIVDFCVVDMERQGQGLVVTCSGAYKDGSLRVVRNGIGIDEQAVVDLPGIKGIWSLRASTNSSHDKYLVQSFIGETRIFAIEGEEMDETELAGFDAEAQTIHCATMEGDLLLQVTATAAKLVSCETLASVAQWSPEGDGRITVATAGSSQVLLGLGGGELVYLELEGGSLVEKSRRTMPHEISCLSMNSIAATPAGEGMDDAAPAPAEKAKVAAIGLWTDITVRLVEVPSLEEHATEALGGDIQARSVLLVRLEGINYLLVGLGDGHLFSFVIEESGSLSHQKKIAVGTKALFLTTFRSGDAEHVFAACDRPTVIYSSRGKLLFSNVNLSDVTVMCPFNAEVFPECLALASEADLTIGTVDDIQKLHVKTVPLGEAPRRIVHHPDSNTLAVATVQTAIEKGEAFEHGYIRLFDDNAFHLQDTFVLDEVEMALAMTTVRFAGDEGREYVVVGTAYIYDDEEEPSKGRIIVLEVIGDESGRRLHKVADRDVQGGVFSLAEYNGRLVAGVGSRVYLFKWPATDAHELVLEASHSGFVLALKIDTRGDFIMVGDLMKSVTILMFDAGECRLVEIAGDRDANWTSAIAMLDDSTFMASENCCNLFVCRKNDEATTDEERHRLDVVGSFHVGEFINRFRYGSMVMQSSDTLDGIGGGDGYGEGAADATGVGYGGGAGAADAAADAESAKAKAARGKIMGLGPLSALSSARAGLLYGTVNGVLGVVAHIPKAQYDFLKRLEHAINDVVGGVGGFKHEEWRCFRNELRSTTSSGFIDGDLVELYLELDRSAMEAIVAKLNGDGDSSTAEPITVEGLTRDIEELARLH